MSAEVNSTGTKPRQVLHLPQPSGGGLAVDRLQLHDNALRIAQSGEQFRIVDMTEPGKESAAKLEQIVRSCWIGANLRTVP